MKDVEKIRRQKRESYLRGRMKQLEGRKCLACGIPLTSIYGYRKGVKKYCASDIREADLARKRRYREKNREKLRQKNIQYKKDCSRAIKLKRKLSTVKKKKDLCSYETGV